MYLKPLAAGQRTDFEDDKGASLDDVSVFRSKLWHPDLIRIIISRYGAEDIAQWQSTPASYTQGPGFSHQQGTHTQK